MRPWQTFEGWLWTVSYLAAVALGWFTPVDVLDQWPQAKEFTDFMASWNMQIRRVGEISGAANQANRFVYSVLWCVMPVAWIALACNFYLKKKASNYVVTEKSWFKFGAMNVLVAWLAWVSVTLPFDASTSIAGRLMFAAVTKDFLAPWSVFVVGIFLLGGPIYSFWAVMTHRVRIEG